MHYLTDIYTATATAYYGHLYTILSMFLHTTVRSSLSMSYCCLHKCSNILPSYLHCRDMQKLVSLLQSHAAFACSHHDQSLSCYSSADYYIIYFLLLGGCYVYCVLISHLHRCEECYIQLVVKTDQMLIPPWDNN